MHNFDDLKAVVNELIILLDEFNTIETDKLDAIQKNRVTFVEDNMKKEQAAIMKLRGLDKKRESIQKDLGWENMSFREILSQVDDVKREELRPLFDRLDQSTQQFTATKDSAQKALEISLHHINTMLKRKAEEESRAYTNKGDAKKAGGSGKHFTNTKV